MRSGIVTVYDCPRLTLHLLPPHIKLAKSVALPQQPVKSERGRNIQRERVLLLYWSRDNLRVGLKFIFLNNQTHTCQTVQFVKIHTFNTEPFSGFIIFITN